MSSRLPLVLLALASGLSGCARVLKFGLEPDYALAEPPAGELAKVELSTGWRDEPPQRWAPRELETEGG